MTGPEHYQAAEQLLDAVRGDALYADERATCLAQASVHATLALTAATAALLLGATSEQAAAEWRSTMGGPS